MWTTQDVSIAEIDEKIFKPNNYDMMKMNRELKFLAIREQNRRQHYMLQIMLGTGITGFSAYNATRMGVLSKNGRIGALAGLAFGPLTLYWGLSNRGQVDRVD